MQVKVDINRKILATKTSIFY